MMVYLGFYYILDPSEKRQSSKRAVLARQINIHGLMEKLCFQV